MVTNRVNYHFASKRLSQLQYSAHLCEAKRSFEAVLAGMKKASKVIYVWCYRQRIRMKVNLKYTCISRVSHHYGHFQNTRGNLKLSLDVFLGRFQK